MVLRYSSLGYSDPKQKKREESSEEEIWIYQSPYHYYKSKQPNPEPCHVCVTQSRRKKKK